jgi:hypothetical protein
MPNTNNIRKHLENFLKCLTIGELSVEKKYSSNPQNKTVFYAISVSNKDDKRVLDNDNVHGGLKIMLGHATKISDTGHNDWAVELEVKIKETSPPPGIA